MVSRRLSPQQIQENISRKGFEELLEQHEWVTSDVTPDLGEDILVRVFDEGISTGISLYIQLKSTQNLESLKLKSGKISYSFAVSDLEHWEIQGIPVLLVVWDINLKEGCYLWVREAIAALDSTKEVWRNKQTTKVHFPRENVFNNDAFTNLRQDLAWHYYPIISKGRDLAIDLSFAFPPTSAGKTKLSEINKFLASGDGVELTGEYLEKFTPPDWWRRLFGSPEITGMLLKFGPSMSVPTYRFQIDFVSFEYGSFRMPYVELRSEKAGSEEATLSNVHQGLPVLLTLIINRTNNRIQLNIAVRVSNIDGYGARQALNLQQILSKDFRVHICDLTTGNKSTLPLSSAAMPAPNAAAVEFVDKVCKIQDVTGEILTFPEDGGFSNGDAAAATELVSIVSQGIYEQIGMKFSAQFRRPAIEHLLENLEQKKPISFRMHFDSSFVEILGKKIELGPMVRTITGTWDVPFLQVKEWFDGASGKDSYEVIVDNAKVVEEFENWPKRPQ